MKWVVISLGLLAVLSLIGVLYVRLASHDPAKWHVDPTTVKQIDDYNQHLEAATFSADVDTIVRALPNIVGGEVLAGNFESGFVTLIVRTPLVGYPDYVSMRIAKDEEAISSVTIFSRSRFGKSDLGANKARVSGVFADLKAVLAAKS